MTKIPWLQVSIPKIDQSDSGMSHLFEFHLFFTFEIEEKVVDTYISFDRV